MALAPQVVPYPMDAATNELIHLGFVVESVAGMPDLKMPDVVDTLLGYNETYINATLGRFMPTLRPLTVLQELKRVIPQLPHDSMTRSVSIFYIVMIWPAIIVVALRFYARRFITPKQIRREDWACLLSLVMCILMTAALWAQNIYGHSGNHIWDQSLSDINDLLRCILPLELTFVTVHLVVKSSFLVFYYRLSPFKGHKRACQVVFAYIVIISIVGYCVNLFQCGPTIDWWDHLATAKCIDKLMWQEAQGSMFVIADFAILILPLPAVHQLQLKLKEKVMLGFVFALGGFISITSIVRIVTLRDWLLTSDLSWGILVHGRWVVVELNFAVIVMCGPALKTLIWYHKPAIPEKLKGTWTVGSGRSTSRKSRSKGSGVDTVLSESYWKSTTATEMATRVEAEEVAFGQQTPPDDPEAMVVTVQKDFEIKIGAKDLDSGSK